MILRISDNDIEQYVRDGYLHLNKFLRKEKGLSNYIGVMLSDIKTVDNLIISYFDYPNLSLILENSDFEKIGIDNTNIKQLKVIDTPEKIYNYGDLIIGESNIKRIELTRSSLKMVDIKECEKTNITIQNNTSLEKFTLYNTETSMLTLRLQNNLKNVSLSGDKAIENINLDRIKSNPEKSSFYTQLPIKKIQVSNCQIYCDVKLDSDILEEINLSNKSTFKSLTINHKTANIKIDDCIIEEKLTIGNELTEAISSKFEITNNTIGKGISFVNHYIKDEFTIEDNRLLYGKWKFFGFSLDGNCTSKITDQLFDGVTFQNCDFRNFDFKDTDIHKAKIINPTWNEVAIAKQKRVLFKGDNKDLKEEDLKELKRQYSNFRKGFESDNNYLDASKFKISEALTRIKILDKKKSPRRHLLRLNKWLNLCGESIAMPVFWYFAISALFAALYLFAGFKIDDKAIAFCSIILVDSTCLDTPTIFDFGHSLLFSLKNIDIVRSVPDFYLKASPDFRITQILTILQKIINAVILFAFYTSMRNFFRK